MGVDALCRGSAEQERRELRAALDAKAVPAEEPAPEPETQHLLFLAGPEGYDVVEQAGPALEVGAEIELDEGRFTVLRVGASPLPSLGWRCAFLERAY